MQEGLDVRPKQVELFETISLIRVLIGTIAIVAAHADFATSVIAEIFVLYLAIRISRYRSFRALITLTILYVLGAFGAVGLDALLAAKGLSLPLEPQHVVIGIAMWGLSAWSLTLAWSSATQRWLRGKHKTAADAS